MRARASEQVRTWIVSAAMLAIAGTLSIQTVARAEDDSLCGPFTQVAQVAPNPEPRGRSLDAPSAESAPNVDVVERGTIIELPAPAADSGANAPATASEALLALPKNAAGAIPSDFELGEGARISQSFFSPVICATLARVTGPAGATLEQLVTVVPDGSVVVPNDVYTSSTDGLASARPAMNEAAKPAIDPDPYEPLQYGLAISGVRAARHLSAGAGVKIALLDSAPEVEHRELDGAEVRYLGEDGSHEVGVHGTLMAGVISAIEGNGFGIAGVAPDAQLVSVPVCTPSGRAGGVCTIYDVLQGFDRAWDADAQIMNLSLSGPPNPLLERGVARLEELGLVVVAAAGNEGSDRKRYPAAYPSVIGVGAIGRDGSLFAASNHGDWVELFAPGVEVLSTVPGNAFAFGNGTSLAAAHVTGVLAVLTSVTKDPKLARAELFRTAHARGSTKPRTLPGVCEVFRRLDLGCDGNGDRAAR